MRLDRDPLTPAVVLKGFTILRQHFKQPDIGDLDGYIKSYLAACGNYTGGAFTAAVERYIETTERPFWPLPATLAKHCRDIDTGLRLANTPQARYLDWSRDPWADPLASAEESSPCPICGARWTWVPWFRPNGTVTPPILTVRHDPILHRDAGVRYTDAPCAVGWRPALFTPDEESP